MNTELYLNPRTKWVQLWEAFRIWIVRSPHVTPDAAKALPAKIKSGPSDFKWKDNRVKAILLEKVLDLTYSSVRDGINWTTHVRFKRASRSIYTCVTVAHEPASALVDVKPPKIVDILKSRFGNMTERIRTKPKIVCEGRVNEGSAKDAAPPTKAKKTSVRKYDKANSRDWTQKTAAEMLGITTRQLRNYKKKPPDEHWPGWQDPILLKLWMNKREDRDSMAQKLRNALPYHETATECARKK